MNWYIPVLLLLALSFSDTGATKRPRPKRAPVARFDYVVDPLNRTLCQPGEPVPPNRIDTAARVAALKAEMVTATLEAYLIPLEDEHGSEGAAHDARLEYISGFTGSNGHAWVTRTKQALWTDGRYFLQADQQMDCNWILMKEGQSGYPTAEQWLVQEIPANTRVGADSRLVGISTWQSYETALRAKNVTLVEVSDLINNIWTTGRPARDNDAIYEHTFEYTGESWEEKIILIRDELSAAGADLYVLTALDETAWTFNLRGSDMEQSPLFYSYAIITDTDVRLYLTNHTALLTPVRAHLNTGADGSCAGQTGLCVTVKEYDQIFVDLATDATTKQKLWVDPFSSYRTYSVAGDRRHVDYSPIQLMKSIKTDTERRKYKECQVRDSAALVEFMSRLEEEIASGVQWSELRVSNELATLRSTYPDNRGTSFSTIAGFGPNGAVIHYRPTPDTDATITQNNLFLLDSGGQYLDGTTDVTRTFHFGTPTQEHIDAYTMVLTSVIDLAMAVWPQGTYGRDIDVFARNPLWQQGLDYNHGTGHGIAYFINVHEGPGRINQGYNPAHKPLYEGMFFSDEPGWYKDGHYGIRLETIVGVEKANTTNNFNGEQYLTFVPVTLVPFEPKLIRIDWLSNKQRTWLNTYHARCMEMTAAYLQANRPNIAARAVAWMQARTSPIPLTPVSTSHAVTVTPLLWSVIMALAVTLLRHL